MRPPGWLPTPPRVVGEGLGEGSPVGLVLGLVGADAPESLVPAACDHGLGPEPPLLVAEEEVSASPDDPEAHMVGHGWGRAAWLGRPGIGAVVGEGGWLALGVGEVESEKASGDERGGLGHGGRVSRRLRERGPTR